MPRKNHCEIILHGRWIAADDLDKCLTDATGSVSSAKQISLIISPTHGIMMDAATILLSFANSASAGGRAVLLDFRDDRTPVFSYFDRAGFFDLLHSDVVCLPRRPAESNADFYRGNNDGLVEFCALKPEGPEGGLPIRLSEALGKAYAGSSGTGELEHAAHTIFGALIDNVYEHSNSVIDGYACLQYYKNSRKVVVAVSDSGVGLLTGLRPALKKRSLSRLSNFDLITHMINIGVSRHQDKIGRGCGLPEVAKYALNYQAELRIRLATDSYKFVPAPANDEYRIATGFGATKLPHIAGTHISLSFKLDNPGKTG